MDFEDDHIAVDEDTEWILRRQLTDYDVTVVSPGNAAGGWEIKVEVPIKSNMFL